VVSKDVLSWRFSAIRHYPKLRRVADSPTKHRPQISVRFRAQKRAKITQLTVSAPSLRQAYAVAHKDV